MRTTLNIDSIVLEELKRLQAREKISLGELASKLLAESIARRKTRASEPAPSLAWQSQVMEARVELEDKDAVYTALESSEE